MLSMFLIILREQFIEQERLISNMSLRELAGRLEMSGPRFGFAVERGQGLANENGYELIE